jgi:enoyl-CoA hydratase/carnithine racemase
LRAVIEVERRALATEGTHAAFVYLARPDRLNAFDWDMLRALEDALRACDADDGVRAVVITGRGRAFSAGADLKSYLAFQHDREQVPRFIGEFQRVFGSIPLMRKPVLAAVNGVAVAGGLELVLWCDFAYAAASARLGDAHLSFGQVGGGGALTLLPRLIGPARTRELVYSARVLSADEALAWGLVNAVVPDADLESAAMRFADGVATRSARAVAAVKTALGARSAGLDEALRAERETAARHNLTSADAAEGLRAFAARRPPRFSEPAR